VNASRDYGVVNDCARQATALLAKHKPEEWGPSPEALPAIAASAPPADAPRGYGLLDEVQAVPRARVARRGPEPVLPALRPRSPAGAAEPSARGAEPASLDPQRRVVEDEPIPVKKRKKGQADDDEDLLP